MKVAVISDIHSNNTALDAVFDDILRLGVEHICVLGDIVGYYYWPDNVLRKLASFTSITAIRGNHEDMLAKALKHPELKLNISEKYQVGIDVAISKLSLEEQSYLIGLPDQKYVHIDDCVLFLCHASPFDNSKYIYPDAPLEQLLKCTKPDCDFVFLGHTHYPFCWHHGNIMVANPGSVGQPRDIGNLASFLVLDTKNKSIVFRRVPFRVEGIIETCKKNDPCNLYIRNIFCKNVLT